MAKSREARRGRYLGGLALLLALALLIQGALLFLFEEARRAAEERRSELEARLAAQLDAEAARSRTARRERAVLEANLERVERENGELVDLKARLSLDVAAKEEELARLLGTYRELEQRMEQEIRRGDVKLTQSGGRLQVDLIDKILFDSGDATISKRGQEVLARVGAVLAAIDDKQIQVSGHTDDAPPTEKIADRFPTNWELSVTRATNVVRFLEAAGVPGKRLVASGHGPFRPVATNATPAGRARNRRIEILLIPLIEPVKRERAR